MGEYVLRIVLHWRNSTYLPWDIGRIHWKDVFGNKGPPALHCGQAHMGCGVDFRGHIALRGLSKNNVRLKNETL